MKHRLLLLLSWPAFCTAGASGIGGDTPDNLLQHAPMAAVYALKACGVDSSSPWQQLALTGATAYVLSATATYSLKHAIRERRPDGSDRHSFPSGHATMAFAGATVLAHEYGRRSPWIAIGGYTMAALVAADRVARDRHYLHDICAGAAIGVAGAELSCYLQRRLLPRLLGSDRAALAFDGQCLSLSLRW